MNAKEANKLATSKQIDFEKKKTRHLKGDINFIHYQISRESKKGYFYTQWDYRNCMDLEYIKTILVNDGYEILNNFPYLKIIWGDENEINHKKFK